MPVRSLTSSVIRWPDKNQVDRAVRIWAHALAVQVPETIRIGYFGSYARGDWGVGSDLDVVVILERSEHSFEYRSLKWDLNQLPVQAELLVYTRAEWNELMLQGGRFAKMLDRETVWVHERPHLPETNIHGWNP